MVTVLSLEAGDAVTAVATEIVQTRALVLTRIVFGATFVDVYKRTCKLLINFCCVWLCGFNQFITFSAPYQAN